MLTRVLRQLEPFSHLDRDALATLARQCRVVRLATGRSVATGDGSGNSFCFLLKGTLRVESAGPDGRLRAGRPEALKPLPDRSVAGVLSTLEPSELLYVDVAPVAFLLERPPLCGLVADWLDDQVSGGDWCERFLRAGFTRGAPRLLQRAFAAMEPIDVGALEGVLDEGARGDAYFIVASGGVEIRRRDGFRARLAPGDGFGEEALLGDGYRRASATMLEHGRLMRVPARAFQDWLLPAAVSAFTTPAPAGDRLVVDLDRRDWRNVDPRVWLAAARTARAPDRSIAIVGGRPRERLRWAFLAARAGYDVATEKV